MTSIGGLFSETLHTITSTKLDELSKKRTNFEDQRNAVQAQAEAEADPLKRLFILVDGVKTCFQVKTETRKARTQDGKERLGRVVTGSTSLPRLETDLKIIDRFLDQACVDPSVASSKLSEWEKMLQQYLDVQSVKYEYATLYGRLVNEWLASEKGTDKPSSENVEMTDAFEEVPGAKRLDSKLEWEKSVFEPFRTDEAALSDYLENLFGKRGGEEQRELRTAFEELQNEVKEFENELAYPSQFNQSTLKWTIEGLQASDLLADEKRSVLKDFLTNDIILGEIADVLNMRMSALDTWSWGTVVSVEQRRKLNGSYSIHLDEDLLQAIFLQYIGVKWSVFFKNALRSFRRKKNVWKHLGKLIPKLDRKRRDYYLGHVDRQGSLQSLRFQLWRKNYFLFALPDSEKQLLDVADGEEEVEFSEEACAPRATQAARASQSLQAPRRQLASMAARRSAPTKRQRMCSDDRMSESEEDDVESDKSKSPMEAKQTLLHLLAAEIAINRRIHGEITCFRSSFLDWNPLLPHGTILTVLKYFGFSSKWLSFFDRFLKAPLKFTDDHGEPRTRQRGTPGAHALSDAFGETIMFCLDFSVNQVTSGALLHRIHDDFWFWSPQYERSVTAWKAVDKFCEAMGVKTNQVKTGAVRIGPDENTELSISAPLPDGQIRWGFLHLNPLTGLFEIDQSMIDGHIEELRQQLKSKEKSIFSWVQAWNTYATTFFTANFGKTANSFGCQHVDKILAAHERIHRTLFDEDGSVVQYLKRTLKQRFGVDDVPDGFLFFPVELGGLGLQNPFIKPSNIRDTVLRDPSDSLNRLENAEKTEYRDAKDRFENGDTASERYALDEPEWEPVDGKDVFMSFEEFVKYREFFRYRVPNQISDIFEELRARPHEQGIETTAKVYNGINALGGQGNLKGIASHWYQMEPYWKWVAQLYGPEMMDRFGGLNVVDPGLLPVGMVSLFHRKRVTWQG